MRIKIKYIETNYECVWYDAEYFKGKELHIYEKLKGEVYEPIPF